MNEERNRSTQANALLDKAKKDEKGRLTVFLGAAPGVGKTYAMLNAAKERFQNGVDVVVGLVETHGRPETEAMSLPLEAIPRRVVSYNNNELSEFDVDSAIHRNPDLVLVDELAHTNIPGSRNKRRYQDIEELLNKGIDVYTTINIQHLASLNDIVLQITGIRVRETVPDNFLDSAREIRFIDLPPADLIDRLQQGKVYLPEYARLALDSFFSVSNLTALRELAMKRAIERVDSDLHTELESKFDYQEYTIKDKLLVLISDQQNHSSLIQKARHIAERRGVTWSVLWVDTGRIQTFQQRKWLNQTINMVKDLGARLETIKHPDAYAAAVDYIRKNKVNSVLVGSGKESRLPFKSRTFYQRLIHSGLPVEVSVYPLRKEEKSNSKAFNYKALSSVNKGYFLGVTFTFISIGISALFQRWLNNDHLILLFVFSIITIGLNFGIRPALATSLLSSASFNFFMTEPIFTLKVYHREDGITLLLLLLVGLICGSVASRIRGQFILLKESNLYADTLKELALELSVADDEHALWLSLNRHVQKALSVDNRIVLLGNESQYFYFPPLPFDLTDAQNAAIEWTFQHNRTSGFFTDTLSAANVTVIPISNDDEVVAALVLFWPSGQEEFNLTDKDLLHAMLHQAINTWRRICVVKDLEGARVKTEVEQIRSALLSSVSHDLKSPLSAMMGAAESLRDLNEQLTDEDRRELVDTILQESRRLDSYIQNLLDMTRLGNGKLNIIRDWVSADDIISSVTHRIRRYFPTTELKYFNESEPPVLFVNAALIEQALFNILENAVRYSPENESISIFLKKTTRHCVIAIEDNGPGIPRSQQDQIFNMFYVVADGDKKKNNTGMGLAICKGMISAHGGTIMAMDGHNGLGTRIEVTLPLVKK